MRKTALISMILVALLFSASLTASAEIISPKKLKEDTGQSLCYTVKTGDTLYGIGKKFGIKLQELKKINGISSSIIVPGTTISIPQRNVAVHVVKTGDTLCEISRLYGAELKTIKIANELVSSIIHPGMKLYIPVGVEDNNWEINSKTKSKEEVNSNKDNSKQVFGFGSNLTDNDIYWLAKLIHAEARGESPEGQIAVGAVIVNRLMSGDFPDSIRKIIFQSRKGVYQFTPVQDGQINLEPDEQAFAAAKRAIKGEDPTDGALFFYNPEISSDQWIRTLKVKKVIGNHVFAK